MHFRSEDVAGSGTGSHIADKGPQVVLAQIFGL